MIIDRNKVEMVCAKCGLKLLWYPSFWHEVHDYKTPDGKYLCPECAEEIKQEAIEKWFKKRVEK